MLKTAAIEIGALHARRPVTCTKTGSFCRTCVHNTIKPIQAETSLYAPNPQNSIKQITANCQKNTATKKGSSLQHMHTIQANHPQAPEYGTASATKKKP